MRIVALLIVLAAELAVVWHVGGFHFVRKRPDWQYFGCRHTYVTPEGEDTGECR